MDTKTRVLAGLRLIVILLGLIGNIITFIVYSRPVFEKNSISFYCRALAILESYTIVNLIYEYGTAFFNYYLGNYSDLSCIVFFYTVTTFGAVPGWVLITFSIDKLLSLKKTGNSLIKKRSFQFTTIASIVLFNLLLYIEIPMYLRLMTSVDDDSNSTTNMICDMSLLPFSSILYAVNLIDGSIIPFIIMFTTSIMSIRLIRKSSKSISAQLVLKSRRVKRDMRFAVTSISFNIMFILLRLPFVVLVVLMSFISSLSPTGLEVELTYLLYFVNNSIGIIVNLVSNNLFRREFLLLFRFQSQALNQSSVQSNSSRKRFINLL